MPPLARFALVLPSWCVITVVCVVVGVIVVALGSMVGTVVMVVLGAMVGMVVFVTLGVVVVSDCAQPADRVRDKAVIRMKAIILYDFTKHHDSFLKADIACVLK